MDLRKQKSEETVEAVIDDPRVAAEAQAAGWNPPEQGSYQDVAARLVDLKGVGRPPNFSGLESDWSDFKFKMESACALLGVDVIMEGPERILTPQETVKAKLLYNILVQVCQGRALLLIRQVQRADGAAAWRRLKEEYEPDVASRHCAVLSGLLAPVWLPTGSFIDQLYQWERSVLEYENATRAPLPGTVRCAVVQRWAPPAVKEFLRLTPLELTTDYSQLRNALIQYSARGRVFDAMGLAQPREPPGPPVPMEIDALQNQGLGKGGGRGKGGFTGTCNRCGKVGHKMGRLSSRSDSTARRKGQGRRQGQEQREEPCRRWQRRSSSRSRRAAERRRKGTAARGGNVLQLRAAWAPRCAVQKEQDASRAGRRD